MVIGGIGGSYPVAPFTGAWIEISFLTRYTVGIRKSHPSRVRGLKYSMHVMLELMRVVAPFTGAWIEIRYPAFSNMLRGSRTLHGCVD